MRIGIFDPYLDTLGGGEKYMLTAAQCLSSSHEVFIFWDPVQESEIKRKALDKFGLNLKGIRFVKNIFNSNVGIASRLLESRKYNYIIYLSDGSIPAVASKLIVHFQFPVEWVSGKSPKTKYKAAQIKRIICNSFFTKSFIDKKFGVKSTVLYPPAKVYAPSSKKENTILHVGRFEMSPEGNNYKKQDVLIDAFKEVIRRGLKNWKFVLVISVREKDGERFEDFKERAKGFPIEFLKNPSEKTLAEMYGKSKLYWHASGFGENTEAHPERAEHFGISTVEAMSAGTVPIVINKGGQKEIVTNNENGFLWDTKEELIDKTNFLIKNKKKWEELSERAKERARAFSNEMFCEHIQKIIE